MMRHSAILLALAWALAPDASAVEPRACVKALEKAEASVAAARAALAARAPIADAESIVAALTAPVPLATAAESPASPALTTEERLRRLVVRGVARQSGRVVAVVNDRVVYVGSRLDGFTIAGIRADGVVVEDESGGRHVVVVNRDLERYNATR